MKKWFGMRLARGEKKQEKARGMMFKALGNRALIKRKRVVCFKAGLEKKVMGERRWMVNELAA